jgi:hypothetical protein
VRYRQVVGSTRQTIMQRFAALPDRNLPIRIPQQELGAFIGDLLPYLVARMHFDLWQTTSNWEHADYPTLLSGIPNVYGRFVPACDPPSDSATRTDHADGSHSRSFRDQTMSGANPADRHC